MSRRDSFHYALISLFLDLLIIVVSAFVASRLYPVLLNDPITLSRMDLIPFVIEALIIWFVVSNVLSAYNPQRNYRAVDEFQRLTTVSLFSLLTLTGTLFFTYDALPRQLVLIFFASQLSLILIWRAIARSLFRISKSERYRSRPVLIVGANGLGKQAADEFLRHTWTGLKIVGFVDDDKPSEVPGIDVIAGIDDIISVIDQHKIEEVVIALSPEHSKFNQVLAQVHALPIQVFVVPNYLSMALFRASVEEFGGIPLVNLRAPAMSNYQRVIKRVFDIFVAAVSLAVIWPVMIVIGIAIRRDSEGPAIFKQTRAGENGEPFTMYKFRTMYIDAEARLQEVLSYDEHGNVIHKSKNDPRITKIGRFLRRTSMDELPQLVNVLRGEMSLVGPRPELPWLVSNYELWQHKRFAVPQGITGWWQINGRSDKPMHLHTEDDLYYIQNYSLLLDILILWRTLAAVFKREGAY